MFANRSHSPSAARTPPPSRGRVSRPVASSPASHRWTATACIAASLLVLPACNQQTFVEFEGARDYPLAATQAETLNVQVFRKGTNIQLTNTSSTSLEAGTLWLNQWWFREVPALLPGASLRLPLKQFVDKYGDPFRAGGFFATRDPDILVLAQWQTEGQLLGLIVVENQIN